MAQREIFVAGNPVLRQKSKKIKSFGASIEDLVEDMLDTMRSADGLGLAAPQIGVPLRLIVIETAPTADDEGTEIEPGELYVYCNPEIIESSGEEEADEGCLSVPGYVGAVTRATNVTVKGQDAKGRKVRTKAEGLLARAFQHEIDHLNGTLFIDRVDSPEKLRPTASERQESGQETTLQ
jgi:peptide deformylase